MKQTAIPELEELERLAKSMGLQTALETLHTAQWQGQDLPVQALSVGASAEDVPVLLCVGGVHGLERIGCQVVLGFLETLASASQWDRNIESMLRAVRVVFLPVVNPVGVLTHRRSNGRGVDLMRNAPVNADRWESPLKIYRGHRLGPQLPWYRGKPGGMEPEAEALCQWVRRHTRHSPRVISVDVHSGFFGADRLWFPYAGTPKLFPNVPEALALKRLLDLTYPRHRYVVEPQARHYTTHGDLWDYIYDEYRRDHRGGAFLPLTLELGASSWLKKSWRFFDKAAFFHPLTPHRTHRVLRRHVHLFEFLLRALFSWNAWVPTLPEQRAQLRQEARDLWENT